MLALAPVRVDGAFGSWDKCSDLPEQVYNWVGAI